jgi:hypothetical protein
VESIYNAIVLEIEEKLQSMEKKVGDIDGRNKARNPIHGEQVAQLVKNGIGQHHQLVITIATTTSSMQCLFHLHWC